MDREQKIAARARLAFRAEQAFGLRSLPLREAPEEVEAPQAAPVVSNSIDLFGAPLTKQVAQIAPPALDAFTSPALFRDEKVRQLQAMDANEVAVCTKCRLCEQRTHTVFGEGDPDAKIMFIGEGPGENEDQQGRPFVGRAGQKLDDMIAGMGLRREQVFIANIVKCRPPGNREPGPDEVATCTPYLARQIEIIRPKVIVTLGRPAAQHMLGRTVAISKIRGQWTSWRGIKLMPTFHPAYILRNYTPETRAAVWDDLKKVLAELGLPVPSRGKKS